MAPLRDVEPADPVASPREGEQRLRERTRSLEELERRYATLLDNLELVVVELDAEGRLERANRAFFRLTGLKPEEVIGKDWFENLVPPAWQDAVRRHFRDLLGSGGTSVGKNEIRTADGSTRLLSWSNTVLQDADGRVSGTLSIAGDVTDLRRSREALRQSEARYQAIVDLAIDGVVTIDEQGIVESFNPAAERIFGYTAEEVVGNNVKMLMPQPYRDEHDGYLKTYRETREPRIIGRGREAIGLRKNGSIFPMEIAVTEVALGGRTIFAGTVRDITGRRRAELLASMGTLTSAVAHEIGTPLNVILGRAEFVRGLIDHPVASRGLDIIIQQVERVTRLINQLLAVARRDPMEPRPVSLNPIVEATLEVAASRVTAKKLRIESQLDPELPRVLGDVDRLSQVVLNVLLNAIDATPAGGAIRLRTRVVAGEEAVPKGGERVELMVEDTGPGIAPENLERIFEPFYTTKESGKGTGLGLAVVQGIVRDHGGDVLVRSTLGVGTAFHVLLPPVRS